MQQLSAAELIGQTYGFGIGTALAALLLVLVWRSGGTDRRPRFLFAACILIANGSGFAKNIALELGVSPQSALVGQIRSFGFMAAATLPLSIVIIWRNNAVSKVRRKIGDVLVVYATSSGLLIAAGLALGTWTLPSVSHGSVLRTLLKQDLVGNLTIYNGLLSILLGAILLLPGTLDNLTDRVAVSLMIAGLSLSSASAILDAYVSLPTAIARVVRIARFQSIVLVVIGSLFYFSRFRAADLFAKLAVRLLLGAALAILGAFIVFGPVTSIAQMTVSPLAAKILCAAAIIGGAMLLYMRLGRWSDIIVERGIYGKRDARLAVREFRDRLRLLETKSTVLLATEALACEVLGMRREESPDDPGGLALGDGRDGVDEGSTRLDTAASDIEPLQLPRGQLGDLFRECRPARVRVPPPASDAGRNRVDQNTIVRSRLAGDVPAVPDAGRDVVIRACSQLERGRFSPSFLVRKIHAAA